MADEQVDLRAAQIESKVNEARASSIAVSLGGGLNIADMAQVFEYAKGMSLSGPMVPAFCRNRPWTCFAICIQALEWGVSAFSLARGAYEVENKQTRETTVAYTAQILHGILEKRAPLKERLRIRYEGEGDDLTCIVTGTFKGEEEPREWRSPKLGERRPAKITKKSRYNEGEEYEVVPGSPLWYSKPMVQLAYDTMRDWGRIYAPDITIGIYDRSEMEESGFEVTNGGPSSPPDDGGLGERLSARAISQMGFQPAPVVAAAVDEAKAKDDMEGVTASVSPSDVGTSGAVDEASTASPAPPLSPNEENAPSPEAANSGDGADGGVNPPGPPEEGGSPSASLPAAESPYPSSKPSHKRRPARGEEARLV